jgi:NTE family protein
MFNWRRDSGKTINLAIQGNGAHGAFTWGVLDRLLEETELSVEGISGTSSGAVNGALVAYGLTLGGPDTAREYLEVFWHKMADACHQRRRPWYSLEQLLRRDRRDLSSAGVFYSVMSRLLLAYDFNSTTMNPLRRVIEETIDFERLRQSDSIRLFVNATDVRTNKIKVFDNGEITSDAVCASSCLPFLFEPVEIDGEHYWDGGFMGNPAIFPLIQHCKASDILLVQANPTTIATLPTTASAILERISEISFTSTLMREMRAIAFINELMDGGYIKRGAGMRRIRMHILEADQGLDSQGTISKFNADWPFLQELHGLGRQACENWLSENLEQIGRQSTVDIGQIYL